METQVWVPLVAAGVALLIGVLSPLIAARASKRTLEFQRQMAQDERIWAKRSETYEQLLDWAGQAREKVVLASSDCVEDGVIELAPLQQMYKEGLEFPRYIEVGLAAYASTRVNTTATVFRESLKTLAGQIIEELEQGMGDPDASQVRIEVFNEIHRQIGDAMAQTISDELHGVAPDDDGRPHIQGQG